MRSARSRIPRAPVPLAPGAQHLRVDAAPIVAHQQSKWLAAYSSSTSTRLGPNAETR